MSQPFVWFGPPLTQGTSLKKTFSNTSEGQPSSFSFASPHSMEISWGRNFPCLLVNTQCTIQQPYAPNLSKVMFPSHQNSLDHMPLGLMCRLHIWIHYNINNLLYAWQTYISPYLISRIKCWALNLGLQHARQVFSHWVYVLRWSVSMLGFVYNCDSCVPVLSSLPMNPLPSPYLHLLWFSNYISSVTLFLHT